MESNLQHSMAEDLGAKPPSLPDILSLRQFISEEPREPIVLIEGCLHQGSKMVIGGTSKSNKSWCLLDMALSVASGCPWWGRSTVQGNVLFLNFELHPWEMGKRIRTIIEARREIRTVLDSFYCWNLRGHSGDISNLRPRLEMQLEERDYALLVLDPAYKLLGDRDENSNGEIANLMNEIEKICQKTRAATVISHHFAKGNASAKEAIDRMSGAGAWARDPDAIMVLSKHEEENAFTCSSILRSFPPVDDFCMRFNFPLMQLAPDLNPESLKKPQADKKVCLDSEFIDVAVGKLTKATKDIITSAKEELGMTQATTFRYLARLTEAGLLVKNQHGFYAKSH